MTGSDVKWAEGTVGWYNFSLTVLGGTDFVAWVGCLGDQVILVEECGRNPKISVLPDGRLSVRYWRSNYKTPDGDEGYPNEVVTQVWSSIRAQPETSIEPDKKVPSGAPVAWWGGVVQHYYVPPTAAGWHCTVEWLQGNNSIELADVGSSRPEIVALPDGSLEIRYYIGGFTTPGRPTHLRKRYSHPKEVVRPTVIP